MPLAFTRQQTLLHTDNTTNVMVGADGAAHDLTLAEERVLLQQQGLAILTLLEGLATQYEPGQRLDVLKRWRIVT